jgi:hypothetical protein
MIIARHTGDVDVLDARLRSNARDRLQALQPLLTVFLLEQALELKADHASRLEPEQPLDVGICPKDGPVGVGHESGTRKLVDVKGLGLHRHSFPECDHAAGSKIGRGGEI